MIVCDQMFESMLRASPSFSTQWKALHEEWQNELPPLYSALGRLARHMIHLLALGQTEELRQALHVVEKWIRDGDSCVREAATVGLLEDLQNANLHEVTQPRDFMPLLLPETKFWWDKVERFWATGAPIVDDRETP